MPVFILALNWLRKRLWSGPFLSFDFLWWFSWRIKCMKQNTNQGVEQMELTWNSKHLEAFERKKNLPANLFHCSILLMLFFSRRSFQSSENLTFFLCSFSVWGCSAPQCWPVLVATPVFFLQRQQSFWVGIWREKHELMSGWLCHQRIIHSFSHLYLIDRDHGCLP